ncbi:hypothetical protein JR316_0000325 [Psilocybe cubensis]|uniref:Uncharacterized protein n=2 Tax=Psilocybe cubensis TaxID=181762 RepID=A0ACB8HE99_PSICU|nr:hypothetical protein JR316_0000325 [Psilocybe cubensis]KAH9486261.1 hypothetical protein JR316_0000325 [Psilocybe cubensis]
MQPQQTKTYLVAKPHIPKCGSWAERTTKFQHYTVAFNKNAKPLTQFSHIRELLTAFTDAVHAHHEAFESARMLHRDISSDNIMIDENSRGLLVDWDQNKSTIGQQASLPERTGTWPFMAYRLIGEREDDASPTHVKDYDLESFCQSIVTIKSLMRGVYNDVLHTETGTWCSETKYDRILNTHTVRKQKFTSRPLETILRKYQQIISNRYQLEDRDKRAFMLWHEQVLNDFPDATESQVCQKLDKIIREHIHFPDVRASHLLSLYLKKGWALQLCRDVCSTTTEADWKIGGSNKFRPELFTFQQSSRNKRKSDSQYGMSSSSDSDTKKHLQTKRSRKDPPHS